MKRHLTPDVVLAAALLASLVACEAKKSSNPLSPSVAGPIPGVNITAPVIVEPEQGSRYRESQQPIRLSVQNASSNGVRPLYYMFEVAADSEFKTKMFARSQVPPGEGRTSVQIDRLELGRSYYWRARAEDGANSGPFVIAQFEVLPRAQLGAPPLVSPINNQRTSSRRPALTVGASERNSAVGPLRYDFQVATDGAFAQMVAAGSADEAGGQTSFTPGADLAANRQHFWRARATDGQTTSDWSATQGFVTAGSSGPPPSPSPSPGGGGSGSCGPPYPNNGPAVVACVTGKYPDRLRAGVSKSQRTSNMEFLRDRIIETGICGGMDLAWNRKRGTGPHSIDALAWRTGGRVEVVDVGVAYDDTSRPLRLTWNIVAGPPGYDPYPRPNCR
jgi:hypothetical protein